MQQLARVEAGAEVADGEGVKEALNRLRTRELVESCDEGVRFQVPLVRRWVRLRSEVNG